MALELKVKKFLDSRFPKGSRLLLGLSGGPDSMALLAVLLKVRGYDFHLAHLDHGWRKESAEEAEYLKNLADSLSLPFHLKTISQNQDSGDLENAARQERLKFFKEICEKEECSAVLLAHHGDDQAETVLKRLFEGASFGKIAGISSDCNIDGVRVLRPFLTCRKREISDFPQEWKVVNDSSNEDLRFLRARMRKEILPQLTQSFGKEIVPSLNAVAEEMREVEQYLEQKFSEHFEKMQENLGHFHFERGLNSFEVKYLLKKFLQLNSLTVHRERREEIYRSLMKGGERKEFPASEGVKLSLQKGTLSIDL